MEIKRGFYKHFKGGYVFVLFTAKHSDRDEIEVVYKGLNNGKFYVRPVESFVEQVEIDGVKVARFTNVTKNEVEKLLQGDKESSNLYKALCK